MSSGVDSITPNTDVQPKLIDSSGPDFLASAVKCITEFASKSHPSPDTVDPKQQVGLVSVTKAGTKIGIVTIQEAIHTVFMSRHAGNVNDVRRRLRGPADVGLLGILLVTDASFIITGMDWPPKAEPESKSASIDKLVPLIKSPPTTEYEFMYMTKPFTVLWLEPSTGLMRNGLLACFALRPDGSVEGITAKNIFSSSWTRRASIDQSNKKTYIMSINPSENVLGRMGRIGRWLTPDQRDEITSDQSILKPGLEIGPVVHVMADRIAFIRCSAEFCALPQFQEGNWSKVEPDDMIRVPY